ncbi:glycosyltransferase [Cytobacillus firmus]|uniref:glycosyltransferase n=1 Tax=Cytobacillus firmus TaxID=1399 RepID=UPI0024C1D94D|nr:glycosyltransferase [Cytobacillus firmus]WHY33854.1 glycosyltransferase [Cytobacillus firmus]
MGENYFNRFRGFFNQITVIGLCENENEGNKGKMVEGLNLNSDFVNYIFIKKPDTIVGKFKVRRDIKKEYIKQLNFHDRVATKAPSLILGFTVRLAKKYKVPLLVEMVGCPWDALWHHSYKGKLYAPIIWMKTKKFIRNSPYVLYVTNQFLQKRYPSKGNTLGCSDVSLPLLDGSTILERRLNRINQNNNDRPFIIGTVGSVSVKYKGQQYVIKAISSLNKQGYNFEYHLVGGGEKKYLMEIAKKYGVENQVKFLGSLPHDRVFEFLDGLDIYIQPSKTEGLPRSLVEAMSRGCPALGTKTGGIPELLTEVDTFKSGEVTQIIKLLKKMDKDTMSKMTKRNFEKAKEYDRDFLMKKRRLFIKEFTEGEGN